MKKVICVAALFVLLAGCSGGSGSSDVGGTAPTITSTSAEGLWSGINSINRPLAMTVLDNGEFWASYPALNNSTAIGGVLHGTGSSLDGVFSATGIDFSFEGTGVDGIVISGNYSAKQSLNGTVNYPALNTNGTFTSTYNASYDQTPSLSVLTGAYTGNVSIGGFSGAGSVSFTSSGAISGGINGGCPFSGTAVPRTKGNVYDISVTFGGPGLCALNTITVSGIGYLGSDGKTLTIAALNTTQTTGLAFVGTKP